MELEELELSLLGVTDEAEQRANGFGGRLLGFSGDTEETHRDRWLILLTSATLAE